MGFQGECPSPSLCWLRAGLLPKLDVSAGLWGVRIKADQQPGGVVPEGCHDRQGPR